MYSIVYFSPTGNTKFIANELKQHLQDSNTQVIDIVESNGSDLQKNEHLIILFSIHAFSAPAEVIHFVKDIPKGIFNKVSIIAVGCNNTFLNDGASLSLRKILNKKDYNVTLDRVIAMPLTIVKKFSEDMSSKIILEARYRTKEISKDLNLNLIDKKDITFTSKLLGLIGNVEKYAARIFGVELYANNQCISCSKCWSQCPSRNIKEKDNKPKFGLKCTMCMRCIYNCPVNAINPRISKFVPIKGGYSIDNLRIKTDIKGVCNSEDD